MFVVPHPLQAHGTAGHSAREQGRLCCGVVGGVVAVTASALHMLQANLVDADAKHFRNRRTRFEDGLAVRLHGRHAVRIERDDGAGRADGRVHVVGPTECRLDSTCNL